MKYSTPVNRPVYTGLDRKLVLAFDIGTTYSGVSYSILDPGQVPEIKDVTRFPGQTTSRGASKVPTIIYYDQAGTVKLVGADAVLDGASVASEEGKWVKAEWFKLHIRSDIFGTDPSFENVPELPPNKNATDIYSDFLRYLFECAAAYIKDSHPNGSLLWRSLQRNIDFVLSHPNGWAGKEQKSLRHAAFQAGLIDDETQKSQDRISFVTEGEASLHFVVQTGILSSSWKSGEGVVIVDAGGGTVDLSSYQQESNQSGSKFREIAIPQTLLSGSVLVTCSAKAFLREHLQSSVYVEDIDNVVKCFDKSIKLSFKPEGINEAHYLKFGSHRDDDPDHHIWHGQLKLSGTDIMKFFKTPATALKQAILEQRRTIRDNISHIVMVGGFSMNDFLFHDISNFLGRVDPKLNVIRPEEPSNKAVSHGAVAFYLDHLVQTRLSRNTFGTICSVPYDPKYKEHNARSSTKFVALSGETRVPDMFCTILPKNESVSEAKEFRRRFNQISANKSTFKTLSTSVWCYRGSLARPRWKDTDIDNYFQLCSIVMDLSHLPKRSLTGTQGRQYFRVDYDLVLLFGLTELKAQIAWKEDRLEKRSPATILYED